MSEDESPPESRDEAVAEAPTPKKKRPKLSKMEQIAKEKAALLADIGANRFDNVRSRTAFILNHNPIARNSDIALTIDYWQTFHQDRLSVNSIMLDDLYRVTRFTSLARMRAKIQNDYGMYRADPEVEDRRAELATEHHDHEIEDRPGASAKLIQILCDESGKTDTHLVLGSVWVVDQFRYFKLFTGLNEWKASRGFADKEFHFTKMGRADVETYLDFASEALAQSDTLGIKIVVMPRPTAVKSVENFIYRMHSQLVIQGLQHEIKSGRVELPRRLTLIKDLDEGSDPLHLPELTQHLKISCDGLFDGKATLLGVESKDSKSNPLLQLADLVAGAALRVLVRDPASERKHKDEFADRLLARLGLTPDLDTTPTADFARVIRL